MALTRKNPIPIVILGGSDRRAGKLPPSGEGKHPLVGYKAVDVRIGGVPLVSLLIERLRASGAFDPILIAGPGEVYRDAGVPADVIETDGTFGENIRASIEGVRALGDYRQMAITTCDILPQVSELEVLLADYDSAAPYDLWFSLIRAPENTGRLGEFGWKPTYRILPERGQPAVRILPGHLAIFDPVTLRLDFLYRLLQIGYNTRNRPIDKRRGSMLRQLAWRLVAQDLIYACTFRLPNVTWSVVGSGVAAARKLQKGVAARRDLEKAVRKIFVRTKYRIRYPKRRVSLPILEGLSLAEDIDTEEEARAIGGTSDSA